MGLQIAFILNAFPVLSETFILNQITGLIDLGHDVQIYSISTPKIDKYHSDIDKYHLYARTCYLDEVPKNKVIRALKALFLLVKNFKKNYRVILSSLNIFKYGKDAIALYLFYYVIQFIDKKYDIIQCHFGPVGNFGALIKDIGVKGKLVTMFHGYDIRLGFETGGKIYQQLFNKGDYFLVNSEYSYNSIINFGADPRKLELHSVGIDTSMFPFKEDNKEEPVVILTVARLVEEKGLHYGIKAIKTILNKNPGLPLMYYIVGSGPLDKELKELVNEIGINGNVHFLGRLNQKEVIDEMKKSHIFLLPSVAESFGMVLLEAQAIGLPIVATAVGSVRHAVRDGISGYLVPARDIDALADRLLHLINHPELWPQMGKAGRDFVKNNYDIKTLNKKLEGIYKRLLAGNSRLFTI